MHACVLYLQCIKAVFVLCANTVIYAFHHYLFMYLFLFGLLFCLISVNICFLFSISPLHYNSVMNVYHYAIYIGLYALVDIKEYFFSAKTGTVACSKCPHDYVALYVLEVCRHLIVFSLMHLTNISSGKQIFLICSSAQSATR